MTNAERAGRLPAYGTGHGPGGTALEGRRRQWAAAIALVHLAGGWALWQAAPRLMHALRQPVLMVAVLQDDTPEPSAPSLPALRPTPPKAPLLALAVPEVTLRSDPVPPSERAPAAPALQAPAVPQPQARPAEPTIPAQAPPPPAAPQAAPRATPTTAPRTMPGSAIAYLVPPPLELPLASRRLGEQGTVWLRVLVGADGQPRQVSVQRSSGYARLDEQALQAMRRARFRPQVENGVAIEWTVVAPLQFEIT